MGCHWIHVSITFCSHCRNFENWPLNFCCVKTLPFIRALQNSSFQQDNARPNDDADIVQTFLDNENFRLLLWPAHFLTHSLIKYFSSTVAEQLARHHTLVTTLDELWHLVKACMYSLYRYYYSISVRLNSQAHNRRYLLLPKVVTLGSDFSRTIVRNF